MFNEIMLGVKDFLDIIPVNYLEKESTIPVAKYLSLGFDIPADSIIKVKRFKISDNIPPITLVDVDYDTSVRVCDYGIIGGEITKIITFNTNLMRNSENNFIAMILGLFADICNSIVIAYTPMMKDINDNNTTTSFVNLLLYAPLVMSIAYIDDVMPNIETKTIANIFRYMYTKSTEDTIASARKLVSEFTPKALFDDCVWYGVTNYEYPNLRCNDVQDQPKPSDNPDATDGWEDGDDFEDESDLDLSQYESWEEEISEDGGTPDEW